MSSTGNSLASGSPAFTLIEVLVTVTILFVGIVGVMRSYTSAVRALEGASEALRSDACLKEGMAAMELQVLKEVSLSPVLDTGTEDGLGAGFRGEVSLRWLPGVKAEGLNEVTVAAVGRTGQARYTLVTWLRDPARK
jgi:type II secretory pathway pseudopilin PulG